MKTAILALALTLTGCGANASEMCPVTLVYIHEYDNGMPVYRDPLGNEYPIDFGSDNDDPPETTDDEVECYMLERAGLK